jgi:hypothetical protein
MAHTYKTSWQDQQPTAWCVTHTYSQVCVWGEGGGEFFGSREVWLLLLLLCYHRCRHEWLLQVDLEHNHW